MLGGSQHPTWEKERSVLGGRLPHNGEYQQCIFIVLYFLRDLLTEYDDKFSANTSLRWISLELDKRWLAMQVSQNHGVYFETRE